ncbi:MAG: YceI family protein [Myxococcota bacterium]
MSKWMMVLATSLLWTNVALAGTTIEGKPKVVFHAEGSPGFLTFDGTTRDLTLKDEGTTLVFTVPMDTVETGIGLRDQHMREKYVETATYPNVVLTLAKDHIQWPEAGTVNGEVTAKFEAHGVELDVPVKYSIKRSKDLYKIKASFPFDTTKHGIEIPTYLGVTIKPAMTADVTVDLRDAS